MPKADKGTLLREEEVVLAKERTILAFMQTGLASIGVGIVLVKLFTEWPFQLAGFILIVIGLLESYESGRRLRRRSVLIQTIRNRKPPTSISLSAVWRYSS